MELFGGCVTETRFQLKSYSTIHELHHFSKYKISHAGRNFGAIVPERGLRQGDPLSSYLFLIFIEGLIDLIHNFERRKMIKSIKVVRTALVISHMFFADDSYIFCKATTDSASNVMQLLRVFECASGQQINVDKSSVFFSSNTSISPEARAMSAAQICGS